MKRFWTILECLFVVVLSSSYVSFAEDSVSAESELSRLRSTYEKEIQKINDDEAVALTAAQEKQIAAMKSLQKQMQEAGKLESFIAIGKEVEKFAASRKVSSESMSTDIPEFLQLQNNYLKSLDKLSLDKAGKIMKLVQGYDKSLNTLQASLTKKNDIQGAMSVKNEREALKNRSEVTASSFLLSGSEVKKPEENKQAEKPAQKEVEKPSGGTSVKADSAAKKKYTGSAEKRVRKRYVDLCKELLKQDMAKAVTFIDPAFVEEHGAEVIKMHLKMVFPFLQIADDPRRKLSVGSVTVEKDGKKATLIPKLWAGNSWHELQSMNWLETDGDWYVDFGRGMAPGQGGEDRPQEMGGSTGWRPPQRQGGGGGGPLRSRR